MRNANSSPAGAAYVAGLALLAVVLLLAVCEVPGLDDGVEEPGTAFRDCPECPLMVRIPAGRYTMGSPDSEAGRHADERRSRVTIDRPFAAGVYEVTFAEWDACAAAGACGHRPGDRGWGRGRQPVIDVSWNDAQTYVSWLSSRTGKEYRLLTEDEWEYVARAGTTTPFHTGPTISADQANYDARVPYGRGVTGRYRERPITVGSLSRNAFGLHDVHGNVAEMVADCHDAASGTCTRRVVRGGSWGSRPELVRSAYRSWCAPNLRNLHNGFRVARTLAP